MQDSRCKIQDSRWRSPARPDTRYQIPRPPGGGEHDPHPATPPRHTFHTLHTFHTFHTFHTYYTFYTFYTGQTGLRYNAGALHIEPRR